MRKPILRSTHPRQPRATCVKHSTSWGADMTIIEQARKIRADMNAVTATLTDEQGLEPNHPVRAVDAQSILRRRQVPVRRATAVRRGRWGRQNSGAGRRGEYPWVNQQGVRTRTALATKWPTTAGGTSAQSTTTLGALRRIRQGGWRYSLITVKQYMTNNDCYKAGNPWCQGHYGTAQGRRVAVVRW